MPCPLILGEVATPLASVIAFFVTHVGSPLLPLTVFLTGLFVHGIIRCGAFSEGAVYTTETDVTQATILHASVPCFVVRDEKVVVVRSLSVGFNDRIINGFFALRTLPRRNQRQSPGCCGKCRVQSNHSGRRYAGRHYLRIRGSICTRQ